MNLDALRDAFATQIREVDEALAAYLARFRDPATHYTMVRYHIGFADDGTRLPSGKRLRSIFSMLIGRACGAPVDAIRTLMLASEISHNASLVHDDVEDGDELRWGRPTVWSRFGTSQAINVGDALIGMTYGLLMSLREAGVDPETTLRVLEIFNRAHIRMAEGQHLDLLHEGRCDIGVETYFDMISRKTAAACECASHSAAVLAAQSPALEDCYRRFGHAFGMLYQVCDDMRSIWGDLEDTGKAPLGDILLRKSTLPLIYGGAQGSSKLHDLLVPRARVPGDGGRNPSCFSVDEAAAIRAELAALGVYERCSRHVIEYRDLAVRALRETNRNSHEQDLLEMMVKLCAEMIVQRGAGS